MNRYVSLILFLALVLGGGLILGFLTAPGEWYAGLVKPSFNPPAWLFGPVWTVLYILMPSWPRHGGRIAWRHGCSAPMPLGWPSHRC